jgi:hypothetical protein
MERHIDANMNVDVPTESFSNVDSSSSSEIKGLRQIVELQTHQLRDLELKVQVLEVKVQRLQGKGDLSFASDDDEIEALMEDENCEGGSLNCSNESGTKPVKRQPYPSIFYKKLYRLYDRSLLDEYSAKFIKAGGKPKGRPPGAWRGSVAEAEALEILAKNKGVNTETGSN